jgi:hypothetical protein
MAVLYPNPAGDEVTLHYSDRNLRGTEALLTDVQGKTVRTLTIRESGQGINLQHLPPGSYFLRLKTGKVLRLVKN